jgi:hypothetical protein
MLAGARYPLIAVLFLGPGQQAPAQEGASAAF